MNKSIMNMNKIKLLLSAALVFGLFSTSMAQLSIDSCYVKAERTYPQIAQYGLLEQSKEYNLKNASMGYLPQFSLSLKATYQTEVTEMPFTVPGVNFEGIPKDQYQAVLALTQTIWDGGAIRSQRKSTEAKYEVDVRSVDVDMYSLKERINNLFFGIVLFNEQLKQNELFDDELRRNYGKVKSYVDNGVANEADLDAVSVELLNNKQQRTGLLASRRAYLTMLSVMIGERVDESVELVNPNIDSVIQTTVNRPELAVFAANIDLLDVQRKTVSTRITPKIGLFANGGIGNPGLNFLKAGFSPYAQFGINLSWNIGGFYTYGRERKDIDIGKKSIENSKDTFLFNANLQVVQQGEEITKIREIMQDDDKIITLRNSVKKASEVKVENGIITVTDYLRDVNAEQLAIQNKTIHEVQLMMAVYKLRTITNN